MDEKVIGAVKIKPPRREALGVRPAPPSVLRPEQTHLALGRWQLAPNPGAVLTVSVANPQAGQGNV